MGRIVRRYVAIIAIMAAFPLSTSSPAAVKNKAAPASERPVQSTVSKEDYAAREQKAAPLTASRAQADQRRLQSPVQSPTGTQNSSPQQSESSAPRIKSVGINNVEPPAATAGQTQTFEFNVVVAAPAEPSEVEAKELVSREIEFTVDGEPLKIPADAYEITRVNGVAFSRDFVIVATATANWPAPHESWVQQGKTTNSLLMIRAKSGDARPATKRIQVLVPGNENRWLLILLLVALAMAGVAWYIYWRKYRKRADSPEAAKRPNAALEMPRPLRTQQPETDARTQSAGPYLLPTVPDDLAREIAEGRGVLVLGAGASAAAGVPSGTSLLLKLVERFDKALPDPLSLVTGAADPEAELERISDRLGGVPKIFDVIAAAMGRDKLAEAIAAIVKTESTGSGLFGALAQCPWNSIVSLTYDRLAERAFIEEAQVPMRVVTVTDAADLPSSSRAGDKLLFKAFGDLDRPPTLAFTIEEMRRLLQRAPAYQRALAGLYQSHVFLFLGVDADAIEEFIQAITPEFESSGPKHYALVPRDRVNGLYQASLSRFGMQLLEYESAQPGMALSDFARQVRNRVRAMGTSASDAGGATLLSSGRITRVRLQSIGPFDQLELRLEAAEDEAQGSPWSVVFGPNGVGKSTILRAIALVLAGDHPAATAAGGRMLRATAREGMIEVQIGTQILKTRLTRDLSSVVVTSLQQTPVGSGTALALGFPALRGARSPDVAGPSNKAEARDPEPRDLVALIAGEVDPRLADFKQWLVNTLVLAEQQNPRAIIMRDLLDKIISDIVPGQIDGLAPLDQGDFVIRVITPEGHIPFDDLSQGMASIFNWVGLLVQRLYSICEGSPDPSREPAIVLIDEVDAHLHPEWQRRLVDLTRRFFPNVQIIATSHSALLAGALRAHELIVLERDPSTKAVTQLPYAVDLYGLRSQDILTSAAFGLSSDRAPEIEQKRAQYFDLLEKVEPTADDQKRMENLAEELAPYRVNLKPKQSRKAALPTSMSKEESARLAEELEALEDVSDPPGSTSSRSRAGRAKQ